VDKDGRVNIPGNIVFEKDSATIELSDAGTQDVLNQLKLFCDENPRVTKLRIEGHTDNDGDDAHNMKLSGERALAVKRWLVSAGVPAERLVAVGFGESRPIADNSTPEGKAQNRRTEFHKAELDGRPYMGKPVLGAPGGQVFE
jgi:OOP family OmpA-OmpF porin